MSLNIGRVLGGVLALSFEAPQIQGTGVVGGVGWGGLLMLEHKT